MLRSAPAHNDPTETKGIVAKGKQQNGNAARDRRTRAAITTNRPNEAFDGWAIAASSGYSSTATIGIKDPKGPA